MAAGKTPIETAQDAFKVGKKLKRSASVVRELLDQVPYGMLRGRDCLSKRRFYPSVRLSLPLSFSLYFSLSLGVRVCLSFALVTPLGKRLRLQVFTVVCTSGVPKWLVPPHVQYAHNSNTTLCFFALATGRTVLPLCGCTVVK